MSRGLFLSFLLAGTSFSFCGQAAQNPDAPAMPASNSLVAEMRPQLIWQRTSPSAGHPEGPVLYQLLFNASGVPGTVAAFDTNPRHLTNSPITISGGNVNIGGMSVNGGSGVITFVPSQTFPITGTNGGTVTQVSVGTGLSSTANPITATGTISLNTAFTDARYVGVNGGSISGALNVSGAVTGASFAGDGSMLTAVNAATFGGPGLPPAKYARVDLTNTFLVDQNFSGNVLLSPPHFALPASGTVNAMSGIFIGSGGGVVGEDTQAGAGIGVQGIADGTQSGGFGAAGVIGTSSGTSGPTDGVIGFDHSPSGEGVRGVSFGTTGGTGVIGVYGNNSDGTPNTNAVSGIAVRGFNSTANGLGVQGQSGTLGTNGVGVRGEALASSGFNFGVSGMTHSTGGIAVDVFGTATSGTAIGVRGLVNSAGGTGALFENDGTGCSGSAACTIMNMFANGTIKFHFDGAGNAHAAGAFMGGGADFAESVAVRGARQLYQPGDVMVIDAGGKRRLTKSQEPYSTRVAGIVSTKPGVLASLHSESDPNAEREFASEVPLAVVGIVPCKVSAENGEIQAGDLLVTSAKPGYAMRGTDRGRMLGAVVGKAMQPLPSGAGTIEVLVTLQ